MRFTISAMVLAAMMGAAVPAFAQPEEKPAPKQEASTKLAVGDAAPALSIATWIKGEPVTKFEKGKVYVVEFWATWCGPCIASMPHMSALQKEFKDKGVTIIGVTSQDRNGNTLAKAQKMVADKGDTMGYTVAWDNERETSNAYMRASGQGGIPCAFVVNKEGKVVYIGHPMFLDMVIEPVLDGKWDIKAGNAAVKDVEDKLYGENGMYAQARENPKEALKLYKELSEKYPALMADKQDFEYALLMQTGDVAGAHKAGMAAVEKAVKAKNAMALNAIAWGIVDPQADVKNKDMDLAMKAAQEAAKISPDDGAILDTLARVYWVKGDKDKAIEIETKAVAKADGDMKKDLEKTLEEYKSGK